MSEKTISLEGYEAYIVAGRGSEETMVNMYGPGRALLNTIGTIIKDMAEDLLRKGLPPDDVGALLEHMTSSAVSRAVMKAAKEGQEHESRQVL